jgi:hypothetical protein
LRLRRTLQSVCRVKSPVERAAFFSLTKERPPIGRISFGWLLARLAVTVSNRKFLSAIASAHYAFIK